MSSGFNYDDAPPAGSLEKWKRLCASNHRIEMALDRMLGNVNHSYDMPYVAGYNKQGTQIYIDRHLPFICKIGGINVCIRDTLRLHEGAEKALLQEERMSYEQAHHLATAVEYEAVRLGGVDLAKYKNFLRPFIKADAKETIERVPYDLDTTPMQGDKKLLSHLLVCMEKDRKRSSRLFIPRKEEA